MKKTKIKALLSAAAAILFWGCAAPMPEAIKIEGKSDYTMTVLGDTHFDGQEYHITEPTYENQKRERKRNLAQWEGKSQMVLAAAAARSSKDVLLNRLARTEREHHQHSLGNGCTLVEQ